MESQDPFKVESRTVLSLSPLLVQELNTSDFLVTHIHAFTLHTTLTVLLKGLFYTRSSRLVPDKTLALYFSHCSGYLVELVLVRQF